MFEREQEGEGHQSVWFNDVKALLWGPNNRVIVTSLPSIFVIIQ